MLSEKIDSHSSLSKLKQNDYYTFVFTMESEIKTLKEQLSQTNHKLVDSGTLSLESLPSTLRRFASSRRFLSVLWKFKLIFSTRISTPYYRSMQSLDELVTGLRANVDELFDPNHNKRKSALEQTIQLAREVG